MPNGLPKLEILMKNNVYNAENCVFLHPKDSRSYTDDELERLKYRDFEARLFITGTQCAGDSAFLRTHHTDNVQHASNFNYVRDYIKAFHVVKNWTCAKSVLTTLLTMCFQLDKSNYCSFAISIASGLSENGKNTDFEASNSSSSSRTLATPNSTITLDSKESKATEANLDLDSSNGTVNLGLEVKGGFGNRGEKLDISDLAHSGAIAANFNDNPIPREEEKTEDGGKIKVDRRQSIIERRKSKSQQMLLTKKEDHKVLRTKFCFLMDIVFKRLAIRKFLVDDERSNIYRLVHCKTKYSTNKNPLCIALFAFILQISLATYIVLEFSGLSPTEEGETEGDGTGEISHKMLPLAIFTSVHSFMVAIPNFHEAIVAYRIFGRIGVLQMMDFIMSAIVPLLLTVTGFFVIYREPEFIEGVINSTALLFIPEIDDQLPSILGLRTEEIVKNFLVAESITTFDEIARLQDEEFNPDEQAKRGIVSGVQFSDFYITNLPEQGMTDDTPFQPYQITADDNDMGHQIDPSSFVTSDCLLKRIEWKYSTGYPNTTKPRVAYLHLTKIDDSVVEIERKKDPTGFVGISDVSHQLEGMFIITTFQMSEDIIKLRVCGSYKPLDFIKAFDCYSLWDMNTSARKAIQSLPILEVDDDGLLYTNSYDRYEDV